MSNEQYLAWWNSLDAASQQYYTQCVLRFLRVFLLKFRDSSGSMNALYQVLCRVCAVCCEPAGGSDYARRSGGRSGRERLPGASASEVSYRPDSS